MGLLSFLFGKKRGPKRAKRSPGRKPKRDHFVAKLKKSAHVVVRGRKRKLYRGKNGGLYYRSKSGKIYVSKRVLKHRGHLLSPGKGRVRRALKKLKKRKLKKTAAAKKRAARAAYKRRAARMGYGCNNSPSSPGGCGDNCYACKNIPGQCCPNTWYPVA